MQNSPDTSELGLTPPSGVRIERLAEGGWVLVEQAPLAQRLLHAALGLGLIALGTWVHLSGNANGPRWFFDARWFACIAVLGLTATLVNLLVPRRLRVTATHIEGAGLFRNRRIRLEDVAYPVVAERPERYFWFSTSGVGLGWSAIPQPHLDIKLRDDSVVRGVMVGDAELVQFVGAFLQEAMKRLR